MARYDVEDGAGYAPNNTVVPALINAPVIFLAPQQRTASSGELWMAASCPDTLYGGCVVWLSNDTTHYYQIGVIDGQSYQGVLTAALPAASGLDVTNTLSVDLAMSGTILESASQETADRLDSLCYVGGELVAFWNAPSTGLHSYDLSYLHRGVFGSTPGAAINAPFVLLSGPLLRYRFNKNAVGGQLYFKFQAFNIYGGGLQDLADCVAYSISVTADGGIKALLSDITEVAIGKENISNKITAWPVTPNNTQYPGAKLVKDSLDTKQNMLTAGANITITGNIISATGGSGSGTGMTQTDKFNLERALRIGRQTRFY